METKAILSDAMRSYESGQTLLTFEILGKIEPEAIEAMRGKDIRLKTSIWREKRSLDANRYFWKLVTLLADATNVSNTFVHNMMIALYGQVDEDVRKISLSDSIDWREVEWLHLRPTTEIHITEDGEVMRYHIVMRGSHTYDTKEMSRLIDGVVEECKHVGIETLPPDEIKRLVEAWKAS